MKAKGCLAESRELNCCEEVYCYFVTAFEAIKIHMLA
jgi:hypothetical protein